MRTRKPKKKTSLSSQLQLIAGEVEDLNTMEESLEITRFVPTILPPFNRATVIGGAPLGCVWTIHGEYGGGKSTLAVAIISSFIEHGHLGVFFDAEHAASKKWFMELGAKPDSFLFYRPDFLEDMSNTIDKIISSFDQSKKDGDIESDKGMVIVVDSINKLTPQNEYTRFTKDGAQALEKGLARHRGLLLQSWLDHMTPIVGKRDIALICIAQERTIQGAMPWEPQFKVKGCEGLMYDSSVQARVMKGRKQWEERGKKKTLVGQEHKVMVFKNKVGFPMEQCSFYTSNGRGEAPIGLDLAKTAVMEAIDRDGHITKSGSMYYYRDMKWKGERALCKAFREDVDLLNDLCIELDRETTEKSKGEEDDE